MKGDWAMGVIVTVVVVAAVVAVLWLTGVIV